MQNSRRLEQGLHSLDTILQCPYIFIAGGIILATERESKAQKKKKIEIKNKNTFEYHQTQLRGKCI